MHEGVQLVGEITGWCGGDQRGRGVHQGAVPRKMNVAIGPQSAFVVLSQAIQCLIGSPMRIAAAVSQGGQLAQHREGDGGAQGAFELGHGGDFFVAQEFFQSVSGVANDVHNVNMTP